MPLGLWKSKWDVHHEETEFFRGEMRDLRVETRALRADYDRDISEARIFNRELLIRLERTYAGLGSTLDLMGERIEMLAEQIGALRIEVHELKDAVDAQTQAILRLVDRFDDPDGRPPV